MTPWTWRPISWANTWRSFLLYRFGLEAGTGAGGGHTGQRDLLHASCRQHVALALRVLEDVIALLQVGFTPRGHVGAVVEDDGVLPGAARQKQGGGQGQGDKWFHIGLVRLPFLCRRFAGDTSIQKAEGPDFRPAHPPR